MRALIDTILCDTEEAAVISLVIAFIVWCYQLPNNLSEYGTVRVGTNTNQ